MFKHLLIPIDGSEFSDLAIEAGVRFARSIGARITGFIAEPEVTVPNLPGFVGREAGAGGGPTVKPRLHAQSALDRIAAAATAAGVSFAIDYVAHDDAAEAIVAAAERHGCDLIVMASRERRGLDRLLHGSATGAVLNQTKLPVLVLH